jgi:YD repeat-containing protein
MEKVSFYPLSGWGNLWRVIGFVLIVSLWAGQPGQAASPVSGSPVVESIDLATGFEEPLIATSPTSAGEDETLGRAVKAYRERTDDDFRDLEDFLAGHLQSGWRVAVLTDLGFSYLHGGYFSRAVEAWEAAWQEGRDATEPHARALVDRAAGELARLHAALGHVERLAALLEEVGARPVTGPATETVQVARETLGVMRTDPKHLYLCGPQALKTLMLAQGSTPEQVRFLDKYRASPKGVSLAELGQLAEQAHLPYRPILRKPGEPVPVPSIVHWKIGHFAAILREADGRFQIKDPVLGQDSTWINKAALDEEGSGYFLAPINGGSAAGWRTVAAEDAERVWGAGSTIGPQPGAAQPKQCSVPGMCVYSIEEMVVGLALTDTPVGYTPPKGPSAKVMLAYNQREDSQPANFSFFNISPKWTLNWLSYVQDDPRSAGSNVMRYLRGGGAYYYIGYNTTTGAFTPQTDDASVLTLVSKSPVKYQRFLKDGSVETYTQSDGSASYPRRVFLTQIADPAGNAVTLNYDTSLRLTSITDATGRSTTFSYNLPGRPLLITAITDPFGRSATLTYDGRAV